MKTIYKSILAIIILLLAINNYLNWVTLPVMVYGFALMIMGLLLIFVRKEKTSWKVIGILLGAFSILVGVAIAFPTLPFSFLDKMLELTKTDYESIGSIVLLIVGIASYLVFQILTTIWERKAEAWAQENRIKVAKDSEELYREFRAAEKARERKWLAEGRF